MGQQEKDMDSGKFADHLKKITEQLLVDQKARHEMNNQLAVTFTRAIESMRESNEGLSDSLKQLRHLEKSLDKLSHWAFGVHGSNGINAVVMRNVAAIEKLFRLAYIGVGIGLVLQAAGVALLIYILSRLPGAA